MTLRGSKNCGPARLLERGFRASGPENPILAGGQGRNPRRKNSQFLCQGGILKRNAALYKV